jgi:hypothetical protein
MASREPEGTNILSVTGLILQTAYRLRRHFWGGWPLSRWLGLLFVIAIASALIRWRAFPWPAAIPAVLYLAYLLILTWAGRHQYVQFQPLDSTAGPPDNPGVLPPLGIQEMVPVRASGWFTVEGQNQYFVDVEADFETVGTREHIVLGRIHPSRFLLLGRWPRYEHGWWYIFFQPDMIRDLCLGYLHFGTRPQQVLRVLYAPDEQSQQTVYLAFDDNQGLQRVREDLVRDAPSPSPRDASPLPKTDIPPPPARAAG